MKTIVRRGYTTKKGVRVSASKIRNRGLPGKGPKLFGPLRHGGLREYGYFHVDGKSMLARHRALTLAMRSGVPKTTLIRRLGAISTLTRRTMPKLSTIYRRDQHWLSR
jgi:hypothetical protein